MTTDTMNRRTATLMGISAAVIAACGQTRADASADTSGNLSLTESGKDTAMADTIDWSNLNTAEWKDRLTAQEFDVLRREGTERPFTSPLNDEKREGIYACAGCGQHLFKSSQKFDSGTGWPSFFDVIDGAVDTKTDRKLFLPRTEYHCSRCGGHQGHVFKDGPRPTGLRYCNNGVALDFLPQPSGETET